MNTYKRKMKDKFSDKALKYLNDFCEYYEEHSPSSIERYVKDKYKGSKFTRISIYRWRNGLSVLNIRQWNYVDEYMKLNGHDFLKDRGVFRK